MTHLRVKYRFKDYPFIVADGKGAFYQLPHCSKKYTRSFRRLSLVLNNRVTEGYRINRKFVSLKQLRKKAYLAEETLLIEEQHTESPF